MVCFTRNGSIENNKLTLMPAVLHTVVAASPNQEKRPMMERGYRAEENFGAYVKVTYRPSKDPYLFIRLADDRILTNLEGLLVPSNGKFYCCRYVPAAGTITGAKEPPLIQQTHQACSLSNNVISRHAYLQVC
jgi:hypothetical protein